MLHDLPAIVYKTLVEQHLSDLEVKTLRLVSKECRSWVDTTLSVLRPRDFSKSQHGELVKLFPNLESLDLRQPTKAAFEDYQSRCQQLRSLPRLYSLKLYWDWTWGKTALSQVIEGLTGLSTFHYEHAKALRDEDLPALTSLVCLRELSLRGADDLGGEGLTALKSLLHLQSLNVSGCTMISTGGLHALATLTGLTALHARFVELSSETLRHQTISADTPEVLDLLSSLTGNVCLSAMPRAAQGLKDAGLRELDLHCSIIPSQVLLGHLAGLSRLTSLHIGARGLLDEDFDGSALLNLQNLRVLGVVGWPIYLPREAPSGGSTGAELALTELHASALHRKDHEVLLHAALRGGKLKALELDIWDSRSVMYDDIPHLWSKATVLTRLSYRDCQVDSLWELQGLLMLKSLTFSKCHVSTTHVRRNVSSCGMLETLQFYGTELSSDCCLAAMLSNFSSLKTLKVPESEAATVDLLSQLAQLTALQDLDLSSENRGHGDMRPLSALTQLTSLGLAHLGVDNVALHVLRGLKQLRVISLANGGFNDTGLCVLTGLTALHSLSLQYCHNITDEGLRATVVPLSRHSLARVDVTGCRGLTSLSSAENMGVICCTIRGVSHLRAAQHWPPSSDTWGNRKVPLP